MRALFVDDEPRVPEATERTPFTLDLDWQIHFADSGEAALAALETARFDVIVSDMRMSGMDGAALLAEASEKHPHVARIGALEIGAFDAVGKSGLPSRAPLRNAHERLGLPQIVWLASFLVYGEHPDPEYVNRVGAEELLPEFKGLMA